MDDEPFTLPPGLDAKSAVEVVFEALAAKIGHIERRLREVENKGIKYRGIFQRADLDSYKRGDVITTNGSMWIALKDSPADAPAACPDWQMCVQRGRDGKYAP